MKISSLLSIFFLIMFSIFMFFSIKTGVDQPLIFKKDYLGFSPEFIELKQGEKAFVKVHANIKAKLAPINIIIEYDHLLLKVIGISGVPNYNYDLIAIKNHQIVANINHQKVYKEILMLEIQALKEGKAELAFIINPEQKANYTATVYTATVSIK